MTQLEYLKTYAEEMPSWLKVYRKGQSKPLTEFLGSRIVYYPGGRTDWHPVEVFGGSRSAHCFVYADYWLSADESLMIVDEADELLRGSSSFLSMLFGGGGGKSTEKGVINTILDEMKIPAVWISIPRTEELTDEYYRKKCLESIEPTFHLAGESVTTNAVETVKVYTNVGEVMFRLNGRFIGAQVPNAQKTCTWPNVPLHPGENTLEFRAGQITRRLTRTRREVQVSR